MTASGAAGEDYSVLTPERVSLRYDVAGIGSRGAAALIDTTIQGVVGLAVLVLYIFATAMDATLRESPLAVGVAVILGALIGFFLLWGYYILFEIVWSGQTPGKRVLGLRVIRENGYPLRAGDAVVRNLIRIVDGPPFGAVLGSLVMLCNDRAKRIGDFAAGTIVVREGKRQRLGELAPVQTTPRVSAVPVAETPVLPTLSADDATLVRDFLVRRAEMYPASRLDLAQRLANHLCQRYGFPAPDRGHAERLLESLASE